MEILCTVEFAFIVISRVLNKDDDQGKFYRDLQASGPCAGKVQCIISTLCQTVILPARSPKNVKIGSYTM